MHVFYTPDINGLAYSLNEEESKHCTKVLRLKEGDSVTLVDGKGGLYQALIKSTGKREVQLEVIASEQEYQKRNHRLHIAVAPTKNIDRLEWFLEKATEMGIDEITPIIAERSERKVVKEDRLFKVITAAVKQSLQAYHPQLNAAVSLTDFLKKDSADTKMIAHCIADESRQFISEVVEPYGHYTILIGPEGDFSPNEIQLALSDQYQPISLGNTRLRTETAALAACFEINLLNRI